MEEITLGKALNDGLRYCMEQDERVFVMGEDVVTGVFPTTQKLADQFGTDRVINTPLSEVGYSGMGVGAAALGMRPVIEFMLMDFITVPMDMIANQAAKMRYMSGGQVNCPIVFRAVTGGGRRVGALHSQNLSAWFLHAPGIKVVFPSTPFDAKGLIISAIRDPNPVLFVEHRLLYGIKGPVPKEPYAIPLGESDIKREGEDVTLVACGRMVHLALEAAEKLAAKGIDLEVIDLRTLDPLDEETIVESVKKTGRLATLDEAYERAGIGSEIVSVVMRQINSLKAPVQTIAAPNAPIPVSPALEDIYYPNVASIMSRIEKMM